jgi:hypothetical protein
MMERGVRRRDERRSPALREASAVGGVMTAVIGIDPGKTGAAARYIVESNTLDIIDMPVLELMKAGRPSRVIDVVRLATQLQFLASAGCDLIVIEKPMAMPGQSSPSVFDIGCSFGIVWGMAATFKIRCELAHPAAWKRAMSCPAAKDFARARASQLLPMHADKWPLKKHDGRAEASLLALYGAQHFLAPAAAPPARDLFMQGKDCNP